MAKLCMSYILCPLIDQKSLVGVSHDSENGSVIVTLGKNMVVRYKLKGQKQISSWSSTLKFTSPVIFDGESRKYASVLGQNSVRLWEEGDETLDQVKKYKFVKEIYCLLSQSVDKPTLVVFRDGTFLPLSEALKHCEAPESNKHLAIQDCKIITVNGRDYITYLTVTPVGTIFHTVAVNTGAETTLLLSRESLELRGHTVLERDDKCFLYTLWSDGKLYSMRLFSDESHPGTPVHTVTEISLKHGAAMTALSGDHLAIYGADVSEEGAILLILNTQFYFVQARQPSKLFGIAPRLWKLDTNLFVASGDFLTVVPYKLEVARLAAVVGSRAPDAEKITQAIWNESSYEPVEIDAPTSILRHLKALANYGWPQSTIAAKLIPKLLKDEEYDAIVWVLKNYEDITEECLVSLLDHCLSDETISEGKVLSNGKAISNGKIVANGKEMEVDDDVLQGKEALLDAVLLSPFADVALLPHVRSISFPCTLALLAYLSKKLATSGLANYSEWMSLMLDSHYQDFLLSKDPEVLEKLTQFRSTVGTEIEDLNNLQAMLPLIRDFTRKRLVAKGEKSMYEIEEVTFQWN